MGLFNSFFKTTPIEYSFKPKNEQDAWVCIFYACAAIDGDCSQIEIEALSRTFVDKTIFNGHDTIAYYEKAIEANTKIGGKALIEKCAEFIAEENKNTVYTICCEVVLADGKLDDEEKHILEFIAEVLNISDEEAIKIIVVMLHRNKYNKIIFD